MTSWVGATAVCLRHAALLAGLVLAPGAAKAGLLGTSVTGALVSAPFSSLPQVQTQFSPQTEVVGPGVEFTGNLGGYGVGIDLTDSGFTFTMTAGPNDNAYNSFYGVGGFTLSGFGPGVTSVAATGFSCNGNFGCSGGSDILSASFGNGTYAVTLGALESGGTYTFAVTSAAVAVPEPASFALLGTGLLGLGWSFRRRTA